MSYQASIRYNKRGQEPIKISASFSTRQETEEFVKDKEADIRLGQHSQRTEADRTTFEDAAKRYMAEVSTTKRGQGQEDQRHFKIFP